MASRAAPAKPTTATSSPAFLAAPPYIWVSWESVSVCLILYTILPSSILA